MTQATTNPTTITAKPGLPFVDIERTFNAPAAAVFRAHTDPALYAQWMGSPDSPIVIAEFDATIGGTYQWGVQAEGEIVFSLRGVFHTVEPNTLLIQTFGADLAPDQVGLSTISFIEEDGRTRMTVHEVYPSVEARDMAVDGGMEPGVIESHERLDQILAG